MIVNKSNIIVSKYDNKASTISPVDNAKKTLHYFDDFEDS